MVMCEKEVWTQCYAQSTKLLDVRTRPYCEGNTALFYVLDNYCKRTALFYVRTYDVGLPPAMYDRVIPSVLLYLCLRINAVRSYTRVLTNRINSLFLHA